MVSDHSDEVFQRLRLVAIGIFFLLLLPILHRLLLRLFLLKRLLCLDYFLAFLMVNFAPNIRVRFIEVDLLLNILNLGRESSLCSLVRLLCPFFLLTK